MHKYVNKQFKIKFLYQSHSVMCDETGVYCDTFGIHRDTSETTFFTVSHISARQKPAGAAWRRTVDPGAVSPSTQSSFSSDTGTSFAGKPTGVDLEHRYQFRRQSNRRFLGTMGLASPATKWAFI